jgi:hypothetical protein
MPTKKDREYTMTPRLLLTLLCMLFATSCLAEPSAKTTQTTIVIQPQLPPSTPSVGSTTPANQTPSEKNQTKSNMADFCKKNTC